MLFFWSGFQNWGHDLTVSHEASRWGSSKAPEIKSKPKDWRYIIFLITSTKIIRITIKSKKGVAVKGVWIVRIALVYQGF